MWWQPILVFMLSAVLGVLVELRFRPIERLVDWWLRRR